MIENKYRHEYKYVLSNQEIEQIKTSIGKIMKLDSNANDNGGYHISSLYFDDYNNSYLYSNINGDNNREKYRIRIYNHNINLITLECKHKDNGKTLKESCKLTIDECNSIINDGCVRMIDIDKPLLRRLSMLYMTRQLKPKVIVDYDRIAYVYNMGNVRVTFDENISSSNDVHGFLDKEFSKRQVMPMGCNLMEVKWDEFIPDYIYNTLSINNLQQSTFSKYYLCRKYSEGII